VPPREKRPSAVPKSPHGGQRIRGRYELHEVAGRGGMAVVWRATQHGDAGFSRLVAVKQMHEHLVESKVYVEMFAEEARVLSTLHSPHVASIFDFVHEKGQYYLVQEWIEGIDLGSWTHYWIDQEKKTRWDLVASVGIGLLRALSAAHERRGMKEEPEPIVHRDVSPHNVLITNEGVVKLIDFGLSLARDREKDLTEPGIVKGKMSYLSPDIVAGNRPSPTSDQFSAASVLWEALVGRKLFEGQNDYEIYKKLRDGQVQPLRPLRRDVPRELAAVIHRALSTDPAQRFESTREMATQLGEVLRANRQTKDLHDALGQSVKQAREGLKAREPSAHTPVADLSAESVTRPMEIIGEKGGRPATLSDATPPEGHRVHPPPIRSRDTVPPPPERKGLLHKLPFFWKR
jgi:eukaryotic-like serine/threonine-protein kinase